MCCVPDNTVAAGCSTWSVKTATARLSINTGCVCVFVNECVLSDDETRVGCSTGLLPTFQKTRKPRCLHDKRHTHSGPNCCLSPAEWENRLPLSLAIFPPCSSSAAFPLFPLSLSSHPMFPPLLSRYSALFPAQPPEIKRWHCNTAQSHQMCAFQTYRHFNEIYPITFMLCVYELTFSSEEEEEEARRQGKILGPSLPDWTGWFSDQRDILRLPCDNKIKYFN